MKNQSSSILIEDFVPYDRSILWSLQDAYFTRRGPAAWLEGDMPFFGLNNPVIARQHARLILGLVDELEASGQLEPGSPVGILEVGAGLGTFAGFLFDALEAGPRRARELRERLVYVLSDASATTLEQAIQDPWMREAAAAGRIVPATLDLREPGVIRTLDGQLWSGPLVACVANYVACVTPLKLLRKSGGAWFERWVRVEAPVPLDRLMERVDSPALLDELTLRSEWRRAALAEVFGEALHAEVAERVARPFPEATVPYPMVFFEALRGLARRILPGGLALINDFGSATRSDLAGSSEVLPEHYGNSQAHEVHLSVVQAFCEAAGFAIARIHEPLRSIQTAAIRFQKEMTPAFRRLFRATYEKRQDGEDMIDFTEAAARLLEHGEYRIALRLYQRCVAKAPKDPELLYNLGRCCLEAGHPYVALRYLERGSRQPGAEEYRFDRLLERARREWSFRLNPQKKQ